MFLTANKIVFVILLVINNGVLGVKCTNSGGSIVSFDKKARKNMLCNQLRKIGSFVTFLPITTDIQITFYEPFRCLRIIRRDFEDQEENEINRPYNWFIENNQ